MKNESRHCRGSGLLFLCLLMLACTILSWLPASASAQQAEDLTKLDWSMIGPAAEPIQSAPEKVIERAIEAQTLDFSLIAKPVKTAAVPKPVLEIVYGDDCAPCVKAVTAYNGPKGSKTPPRLRQFLDQHFEVRWIKYDRSEIERRRYEALAQITKEPSVPLFAIDGGKSHVVGFSDSESLIAALTTRMPKPVQIRPSK